MALEVIGLVAGVLGIWSFAESHFPETPAVEDPDNPNEFKSTVRIQVGLDGADNPDGDDTLSGAGGLVTQVIMKNGNGDVIAYGGPGEVIESGEFSDAEMESTDGTQAVFTEVRGSGDDICIATMTATWSDESRFGWTGDWGSICGLPSYYSGIFLENGESPWCTWIAESTDVSPAFALGITWADFVANGDPPSDEEAQEMCGSSMQAFSIELEQILAPNEAPAKKRGLHNGRSDDRLIVSSRSSQNATTLCATGHSYGPDFVSIPEETYCNMETRETLPLCSEKTTNEQCFDLATHSTISTRDGHKPSISARNPTKVIHW